MNPRIIDRSGVTWEWVTGENLLRIVGNRDGYEANSKEELASIFEDELEDYDFDSDVWVRFVDSITFRRVNV